MIAIYARKSVFREDSISIESQIEQCRYEAKGAECVIYSDNGFSGKNTDRPEYQRMMEDIRANKINKVIVYKLDRISRSILDFSNMMSLFQEMGVAFVSATEHFDTSSPMGRAMLNICIVFAQLERETIQQRVADAYMSRSKKGFYMGGAIPYGYTKVPITIQGVRTSMYEPIKEEANDIRYIFELYSHPNVTLGDVVRQFEKQGRKCNLRGKSINISRLSETIRNPLYTQADRAIYDFYKEQGVNIVNSVDEFNGETGLYLFHKSNSLVIAPHQGIVDSETWLKCRRKLLNNAKYIPHKAIKFLYAGKVKCGFCGHAMTPIGSPRKKGYVYYLTDVGHAQYHICTRKKKTFRVDELERLMDERLKEKINTLSIHKNKRDTTDDVELRKLLDEKEKVSVEIENLLKVLAEATSSITMSYVEQKLSELDTRKKQIETDIEVAQSKLQSKQVPMQLTNVMSKWNKMSFDDKRAVVLLLIDKILVYNDEIEIIWNV